MADLLLRPAAASDAADLAILDNIAGHGISLWFWQGAVKMGKAYDAYDFGRARMQDAEAEYGWKNTRIAERNGLTQGACCSYRMPQPDPEDEKSNPEPFIPVFELFSLSVDHWFVDSLAVFQSARDTGAGSALLDDAFERGRVADCAQISLVVEDSNAPALGVYTSRGMVERDRRPFISFGSPSDTKNWLLLSARLG